MNLCKKHCKLLTHFINYNSINKYYYSILFLGSDSFSLESLKILLHNKSKAHVDHIEVCSSSYENAIGKFCKQNQIPFSKWPDLERSKQFDVGVVSSFGHLISSRIIKSCKLGMINVHGSLLPRWRGASPIQYAILNGDKITGITLMKIHPKRFDVGEIIFQQQFEIPSRATFKLLYENLAKIGAELLLKCFEDLETNLRNAKSQSEDGITYAPKLKPSDGLITWSSMDSYEIDRRYRAFSHHISIYTHWIDGNELRLVNVYNPELVSTLRINSLGGHENPIPGQVYYHKKRKILCISSANNTWSAFDKVCLKGRKMITALQFYNGYLYRLKNVNVILGLDINNNAEMNECNSLNVNTFIGSNKT